MLTFEQQLEGVKRNHGRSNTYAKTKEYVCAFVCVCCVCCLHFMRHDAGALAFCS